METSSQQSRTAGVVIPAFNEADNILPVLNTVCALDEIQEIILVDDGSSDTTSEVALQVAEHDRRLVVIRLPENRGKAAAMLTGVRALHTDLVIFLDADLVGLMPHHLKQLISLQKAGSHEMAIAVFKIGKGFSTVPQRFAPYLSGQRCLWRQEAEQALLPLVGDRYGVETGLNIYARHNHWHVQKVVWRGVTHHMVWKKQKVTDGFHNRLQMYGQIVNVLARSGRAYRRELQPVRLSRKFRLTPRR